jgi:acyl carrier protein
MSMNTTVERVREIAAREFKIKVETLTADTDAADVGAWDSTTHLVLMMAIEDAFGISFELDEVVEMTTIGKIAEAIDAKAAGH